MNTYFLVSSIRALLSKVLIFQPWTLYSDLKRQLSTSLPTSHSISFRNNVICWWLTVIRMYFLCVFWLMILERELEEWENNIFIALDYTRIFSVLHTVSPFTQSFTNPTEDREQYDLRNHTASLDMLVLSGCPFLKSTTPRLMPSPSHSLYPHCWGLTLASVDWALCRGVRLQGHLVAFQFKGPIVMWESWDCECCIVPEQRWEDRGDLRVW